MQEPCRRLRLNAGGRLGKDDFYAPFFILREESLCSEGSLPRSANVSGPNLVVRVPLSFLLPILCELETLHRGKTRANIMQMDEN